MNASFLCLGGNIGNRLDYLNRAKEHISAKCGSIVLESPVYETKAWPATDNSPDHLNQCIKLETHLRVHELLQELLNIEHELGRDRDTLIKNQARIIDIDILLYNNDVVESDNCIVPHPRLHLRNFVLVPLNDIASEVIHPLFNKSIHSLLKECNDTLEVKRMATANHKQSA